MFYHCEYFRHDECETKLDTSGRLLGQVKTGVEHLAEKLKHVKTVSIHLVSWYLIYQSLSLFQPHSHILKPRLEPGSEEAVLELLSDCEQKLVSLVEELGSRDLDTIQREMEDEEVCIK